jgi:hypothetical protein
MDNLKTMGLCIHYALVFHEPTNFQWLAKGFGFLPVNQKKRNKNPFNRDVCFFASEN